MNKIALIPLLFVAVAFTATPDSVMAEQRAVLQDLQNMDISQPGVLLTGEFKSDANSIMLKENDSKHTEINAATEANIEIQARPTAETRATVRMRIHQDWQKSREEGISPFLFHWLSYDGKAWEKRIDFNLGDMRVAYTPLTIFMPGLGLSDNEPEIFAQRRKDIMAYSNLDGGDGRLLQGLNFSIHSGQAAFLDDIYLQVTGSRLRAQAKKYDQVALDIDNTDRFLIAGRGGIDLYGISFGGSYIYTFSREKAAQNFVTKSTGLLTETGQGIPFLLEDNKVLSLTLGLNIAELTGLKGWKLNLSGEYANSKYESWWLEKGTETEKRMKADSMVVFVNGEMQTIKNIGYRIVSKENSFITVYNNSLDDKAVHALLELAPPRDVADILFKFRLMQNGKNFVSELSQSPEYFSASVLNASALRNLRSGILENLYFSDYSNDPLTQLSLINDNIAESMISRSYLYNNYRKAHFVRTGYTGNSLTPAERMSASPAMLDPAINLSMPWGLATPDRSGFLLNFEWALLDNKISLNANASRVVQSQPFEIGERAPVYLDFGGGFSVEAGRFMGLQKPLTLQAGFKKSTESDGYERSSQNSTAGLRWGVWRGLSLIGGFETVKKDYGLAILDKDGVSLQATELLWLAGPEVKLSEGAYFNLQYGMLNNEFEGNYNNKLDRNIITADVRVKF